MSGRRVTTVTVPVQVRSGVAFEAYRDRTPLLTIWATRPALLVTLTLPERIEPGHVRFARQLATSGAAYATEVERRYLALLKAGYRRTAQTVGHQQDPAKVMRAEGVLAPGVAHLDVPDVTGVAGGAGDDRVAQCFKQRISVEGGKCCGRV